MSVQDVEKPSFVTPSPRQPVRTCVGCRTRAHQGDLLRVVLDQGRLLPDPRREHSGRGAYVHPSRGCVTAAIARKAFGRALRSGGPLDPRDLADFAQHDRTERWERRDDNPMSSQR